MAVGTVNRITLVGPLGNEPVIRRSQLGRKIAVINLVTLCPRTKRKQWHRCVIYLESQAEFAERHLHTGSMIFVEGQLETRKWFQKDGAGKSESWTAEIAVAKLVILDREHFDDRAFEDEAPAVPDTAFKHDDADGFDAPDVAPTPLSIKRSAARFGDGADAEPDRDGKIDASLPWLG
jgi:single stranded DNA-binding protein